jgi:hypothetical protein
VQGSQAGPMLRVVDGFRWEFTLMRQQCQSGGIGAGEVTMRLASCFISCCDLVRSFETEIESRRDETTTVTDRLALWKSREYVRRLNLNRKSTWRHMSTLCTGDVGSVTSGLACGQMSYLRIPEPHFQ